MTRLTLALILIASTAHATPYAVGDGNGGWKPNPECTRSNCPDSPYLPPEPSRPKGDTDRDPQPVTAQPQYNICCTIDGKLTSHGDALSVLFYGKDAADARAYAACEAKDALSPRPACPVDMVKFWGLK